MNRHVMQGMLVDSTAYGQSLTLAAMGPVAVGTKSPESVTPMPQAISSAVQPTGRWLWATVGGAALASLASLAL